MTWIKRNWLLYAFGILVIILLIDKACRYSTYKEDIKNLDDEISILEDSNKKLDDVVFEALETAKTYEKKVKEKETIIAEKNLEIRRIRAEKKRIPETVMTLAPSEVVIELREVLDCAEIELTDRGILFSEECAKKDLIRNKEYSMMQKEINKLEFSLTASQEALHSQKTATWNVYRIAWAQGSQIINYRDIIDKKDTKFLKSEKQRKKSFWEGIKLGVTVGAGVTVTFLIVVPAIKAIF